VLDPRADPLGALVARGLGEAGSRVGRQDQGRLGLRVPGQSEAGRDDRQGEQEEEEG